MQNENEIIEAPPHGLAVVPTRLAFCTNWELDGTSLSIEDEFDEVTAKNLPLAISSAFPIFLAIFFSGLPEKEKPQLHVRTPDGTDLLVRLPPLKRNFENQVQMNELAGFEFRQRGSYAFTASLNGVSVEKVLTVN